jgi:lipoprotein-releasing system permease protein
MNMDWLSSGWTLLALAGAAVALLGVAAALLLTPVYKHLVCLRYLFSGWKAVVPLVSALPAALGVFLLILVFAIMDGFANDTQEMTRGTLADIIVDAHLEGMPYYEEFAKRIQEVPGVEATTPTIQTYAMARIEPTRAFLKPVVQPCLLIGIRPADKVKMGRFRDYLQRQNPKLGEFPVASLLKVPDEVKKLRKEEGLADRPGLIGGIGVVGAATHGPVTEKDKRGAGLRVLVWNLAGLAGVVALFLWQASRRRPGRRGWRIACRTVLLATVVLAAGPFFLPDREVEVTRTKVIDYPLIDCWDDLVISTIPVRESGALDVGPGGVPNVSVRKFTLVDTFKSGFWEADSSQMYVDFAVAQGMAGMAAQAAEEGGPARPGRASQIHVKIRNGADGKAVRDRIIGAWRDFAAEHAGERLPFVKIQTWQEQQQMILTVVQIERNITALMLGLMFLGFAILTALISYVMAYIKQRDVGVLKALGARDAGVGSLFLGYGFIIGLIGTAAGLVYSLLMLKYLDDIEQWVNDEFGVNVFPREMYYFDHIPQHLTPEFAAAVCLSVLALATLASLAGGLLAAMKQPVEALRYE